MRLDARKGDGRGWVVWHVERCEVLKRVVWVDDETAEYFQLEFPLRLVSGELAGDVHRAFSLGILADGHEAECD